MSALPPGLRDRRSCSQGLIPFPVQQHPILLCLLSFHRQRRGWVRGGLLQHLPEPKFSAQTLSMKLTATPFATGAARSLLEPTELRAETTHPQSHPHLTPPQQDQSSAVCLSALEEAGAVLRGGILWIRGNGGQACSRRRHWVYQQGSQSRNRQQEQLLSHGEPPGALPARLNQSPPAQDQR